MAEFGATLVDQYGNVWSTPQTTPISLVQKIDINPSSPGSVNLSVNASSPFLIAAHGSVTNTIFWLSKINGGYVLSYATSQGIGAVGNVTIYIFGYVIPQQLPSYGIAIWNSNQQCILTNETKVMPAPASYGDIGGTNIGYLVDVTVSGKWAVMPKVMGVITGIVNTGGLPRPVSSPIDTCAYFDGSTTRIRAMQRSSLTGASNISFANSRDQIFAIDVSKF